MSNRKKLTDIANILAIRKLEKTVALGELATALGRESDCLEDKKRAEQDLEIARQDWRDNLGDEIIIPEVFHYLSKKLVEKHSEREHKKEDLVDAQSIVKLKQTNWVMRDALVAQSVSAKKKYKKNLERKLDEKRMTDLEDIVAFQWWCR